MPYELQLETFKGPIEKLLELIEAREFDVSRLSMAAVTDDFLAYVKSVAEAAERGGESRVSFMHLLADFVAVASRLILLKSKSLLPALPVNAEEELEMKDLEMRLKLFQRLKPAMKALAARWGRGGEAYARPYLAHISVGGGMFYPGRLDAASIHAAMAKIFTLLEEFARKEETISGTIISLEERMRDVMHRIESIEELPFEKIRTASSRAEIIVTFLAILHLARDHAISLEQKGNFSDIIIRRQSNSDTADKPVT